MTNEISRRQTMKSGAMLAGLATVPGPLVAGTASNDVRPALSLDDLRLLDWVESGTLAPDGRRGTYRRLRFDDVTGQPVGRTIMFDVDRRQHISVPDIGEVAWAPDSTRFAYVRESDGAVILREAGGAEQVLASGLDGAVNLAWRPDGKALALCATVPMPGPVIPPLPDYVPALARGQDELAFDTLHYKYEYSDAKWSRPGARHLFLIELTGAVKQLTKGPWNVGAYESGGVYSQSDWGGPPSWSPDGRFLYFNALIDPNHDLTQRQANIHRLDIASGAIATIADGGDVRAFFMRPQLSPDGRTLAWLGYTWSENHRYLPSELWIANADGSKARRIAPELELDGTTITWASDSRLLYVAAARLGYQRIYACAPGREKVEEVSLGADQNLVPQGVAAGGALLALRGTPDRPYTLTLFKAGQSRNAVDLTPFTATIFASRRVPQTRQIDWRDADGVPGRGWVYLPVDFDPAKTYPVIVRFHGGPSVMVTGAMQSPVDAIGNRAFIDEGYVVLWPGYRGDASFGRAYGNDPLTPELYAARSRDLDHAMDALARIVRIDPRRQYIEGASYGGHMAAFLLSTTDRFAAGIVGQPLIDFISSATFVDERGWAAARFATPFWESPQEWIAASPLFQAHKIRTPTLVIGNADDIRTGLVQAEQFYAALKEANRAEARLVVLRGVGHWPKDLANTLRPFAHMRTWMARHVKPHA